MLPIAIEPYRLMTLLTSNNKLVLSFPIEKLFVFIPAITLAIIQTNVINNKSSQKCISSI